MIDILLAAYNGEQYIEEQIDSIIAQTSNDWRLIVQDDCSTDNTPNIIEKYAKQYPNKIFCHKRTTPTRSAKANFMDMLKYVQSEYIMFSDQDDVWLPNKIEQTAKAMEDLENSCKKGTPLLIHSDLIIVDSELKTINQSMFRYSGLKCRAKSLKKLFVQNNVTGCTVMINKALMKFVENENPQKMLMHDWWFALIAAAFGKIGFVKEPLIEYRQHKNNQLGAVNNRNLKGIIDAVKKQKTMSKKISRTYEQASEFYSCYMHLMNSEALKTTETYLSIPHKNKMCRIYTLVAHGYLKQNLMAAIGQIIFC